VLHGFHGRYWRFDLSRGEGDWVDLPPEVLRRYVGGVGLGCWILYREAPAGVDPFAPEAPLVFSFSPLVGTPLTTSAKFAIVGKSPLTGLVCDALSGSHFAIAGKRMGADAIVLVGRCEKPSILVDGRLEVTDLWGRSAHEVTEKLASRGRVAAIGVAGEQQVRFATISNDGRHAGRGGLGAVMGSKRLKALVVRGGCETSLSDRGRVLVMARDLSRRSLGPATSKYRELGTAGNLATMNRIGALPTRNFSAGQWDAAEAISAEALRERPGHERASCANCSIGCEHRYAAGDATTRVEYESLFALIEAARRCDALGLDTVSTGGTIAFAMECAERGLLVGAPEFGDGPGMLQLIDDIARRRGLGARLAEGSRRAAQAIGGDAPGFAAHVKGLELPGYEPRALQTLALGFAVGTRGADHNKSSAYELDFSDRVDRLHGDSRAAKLALEPEDRAALFDSLILCKFLRGVFEDVYAESAEMLRAVTGMDFAADELHALARRVVDLRKAFNQREGWSPADDTLPDRFLDEPLANGAVQGARLTRERLQTMIRSYNLARGWSERGEIPESAYANLAVDATEATV
jgi:aldehyde:ferredoxin oxidoreductase